MLVKQFDFKNALKIMDLMGGTFPQDSVKLYSDNNCLKMFTTYLGTKLSIELPCFGDNLKATCVNIGVLLDIVKSSDINREKEVELDTLASSKLYIRCDNMVSELNSNLEEFDKATSAVETGDMGHLINEFEVDGGGLADAFSYVLPVASTDTHRPHINCVQLSNGQVCATDGHRLQK
jgi:hypothetical protein